MHFEHLITTGNIMSADTKIAELLTELHQLIKQTQVSLNQWFLHPSAVVIRSADL